VQEKAPGGFPTVPPADNPGDTAAFQQLMQQLSILREELDETDRRHKAELASKESALEEVERLRKDLEIKQQQIKALDEQILDHDHDVTIAVASEALRGIEMMEKMEKSIEDRKGREMSLMGRLKDAVRGVQTQGKEQEWEARLASIEAETQERERRDAAEIEQLRASLAERQQQAHSADHLSAPARQALGLAPAASEAAGSSQPMTAEEEAEKGRVNFELLKARTELELTKREEQQLAEKVDAHMAQLQLQMLANDKLRELQAARSVFHFSPSLSRSMTSPATSYSPMKTNALTELQGEGGASQLEAISEAADEAAAAENAPVASVALQASEDGSIAVALQVNIS
jgi:chromosome segregation ATPase